MIIETGRLILRPLTPNDLDAFACINADEETMRFFPATMTRAQSAEAITRYQDKLDQDGYSFLGAHHRATGKLIGVIGISRFDEISKNAIPGHPEVEVGWRLDRAYWGQGLAPEGAHACLAYGFDELHLNQIVAITTTENAPSRRVMEKIGMSYVPGGDFDHPKVEKDSPVRRHVLYSIERGNWNTAL